MLQVLYMDKSLRIFKMWVIKCLNCKQKIEQNGTHVFKKILSI